MNRMRKAGVKLGKDVAVPVGTFRIKGLEDRTIYNPAMATKEVALEAVAKMEKFYSDMPTDGLGWDACFEIGALLHFDIPIMRGKLQSRDSKWRFQFAELWNRNARLAVTLQRDTMNGRRQVEMRKAKAQSTKIEKDRERSTHCNFAKEQLDSGKSFADTVRAVSRRYGLSERQVRRHIADLRPQPVD